MIRILNAFNIFNVFCLLVPYKSLFLLCVAAEHSSIQNWCEHASASSIRIPSIKFLAV